MNSCYREIGNGQTSIVFLHGWGCDGSVFEPVVNRLHNCTSYLVDFAGFGKSSPPPESGWDVVNYANDIKEFFEDNNLNNVTIVAHSFGCRVAMVLLATYPHFADKLLLVAPAGLRKFSLSRWWKVKKYRCHKYLHSAGIASAPKITGSADYRACPTSMKNTFVKVINQDLSFYAKRLKCETLIVNGRDDGETPLSHAKRLHRMINKSELAEIDGGHFAFFYSPVAFAKTIETFVGVEL